MVVGEGLDNASLQIIKRLYPQALKKIYGPFDLDNGRSAACQRACSYSCSNACFLVASQTATTSGQNLSSYASFYTLGHSVKSYKSTMEMISHFKRMKVLIKSYLHCSNTLAFSSEILVKKVHMRFQESKSVNLINFK